MDEYANQEYIEARDKLIPAAEKYANKQEGNWAKNYILKMDRLAFDAGIQDGYLHRQSRATVREEKELR